MGLALQSKWYVVGTDSEGRELVQIPIMSGKGDDAVEIGRTMPLSNPNAADIKELALTAIGKKWREQLGVNPESLAKCEWSGVRVKAAAIVKDSSPEKNYDKATKATNAMHPEDLKKFIAEQQAKLDAMSSSSS